MFIPDKRYKRSELHEEFGGQEQGGISTPSGHNFVILFTSETGQQYGYYDGWSDDGIFLYTEEGQQGDMGFTRGNAAIRDHGENGKDLHLFEKVSREGGYVRYVGQMVCTGFHERRGPDVDGNERRVIVFELAPLSEFDEVDVQENETASDREHESLEILRENALAASSAGSTPAERKTSVRRRSDYIRRYVRKRADGRCESCGNDAPFRTGKGDP